MLLRKALGGLGWVSAFSIAQMATNLVLTVILARLLAPAEVGSFVFALAIVSFLQIFAQLGTNAAAVQIEQTGSRFFSVGFTIVLAASVSATVLAIGAIGVSRLFASAGGNVTLDALQVLVFSLPFFAIADFFQALYNRKLVFRVPAAINFGSYIVGFGAVSLALASLGFGTYALIFAFIAQHVLRSVLLCLWLESRPGLSFAGGDARQILHYGVGFSIAKIGNVAALQLDNLIVASSLGNAALGLYSRAYQITMSPINLITTIVDRVLFPLMSRRQKDVVTLRKAFLMLNSAIFAVFLPLSLLLFEYSYELVWVLLGSAWSDASVPFGLLGVALSFRAGYRLSDIVARARGYVYRRAMVQWIYAGAIALGAIVGASWGLEGVALGVSLAVALNWVLMTSLTMHSLEIGFGALLTSMRVSVFTMALVYLAAAGLNITLGRTIPLAPSNAYAPAFVVIAMLSGAFSTLAVRGALRDWMDLLQRARRAG